MSWLSDFGGSLFGSALGSAASIWSQQDAQDFQREVYQNRYQWTTEDMRAAGLNPILAASAGFGNMSSSAASTGSGGSAGTADISAAARASSARASARLADQQVKTQQADERLKDSQSAQALAEARLLDMNAQAQLPAARAQELQSRADLNNQLIGLYDQQIAQIQHDIRIGEADYSDRHRLAVLYAQRERLSNNILGNEVITSGVGADFARKHPEIYFAAKQPSLVSSALTAGASIGDWLQDWNKSRTKSNRSSRSGTGYPDTKWHGVK